MSKATIILPFVTALAMLGIAAPAPGQQGRGCCDRCCCKAASGKVKATVPKAKTRTPPPAAGGRPDQAPAPAPNVKHVAFVARLQKTLAMELYARDYYRAASRTARIPRFGNLAGAEQRHADSIAAAIRTLGGKPVAAHDAKVTAPATLAAANAECRRIEQRVIAIYRDLIEDCPDERIRAQLERIQGANRRHLRAAGG